MLDTQFPNSAPQQTVLLSLSASILFANELQAILQARLDFCGGLTFVCLFVDNDCSVEGGTGERSSGGGCLHPTDPPITEQPEQLPAADPGNTHIHKQTQICCVLLLDPPKQQGMCCMLTANPAVYFNGLLYGFTEHTPMPTMLRPASLCTHFQI